MYNKTFQGNFFIGTNAERVAFAAGRMEASWLGMFFYETDTKNLYVYGAAATGWVLIPGGQVKREQRVPAFQSRNGASAPTIALRQIGSSTDMLTPVVQFSKTTQQDVYFIIHGPKEEDDTQDVAFHIMWVPGANWTTGNYMWKLEYIIKTVGNSLGLVASTTIQANITPTSASILREDAFASAIGLNSEQLMFCHFYRDVANDNGDDTGDVLFFEIEYFANKLGEIV